MNDEMIKSRINASWVFVVVSLVWLQWRMKGMGIRERRRIGTIKG